MTWRPLGEPNHPPLENEMLWANLAYKAQDATKGNIAYNKSLYQKLGKME